MIGARGMLSLLVVLLAATAIRCGSTYPRREIQGETFPRVEGTALSGQALTLPDAFRRGLVILVLAYDKDAQFDVDRWGIGFFTADLEIPPVYEIPTIPGLLPTIFKESIDSGMRKGIPEESWKDVITVYGSGGSTLAEWTGTEDELNARVLLLDGEGRVLWAHDRGYGLGPLERLLAAIQNAQGG